MDLLNDKWIPVMQNGGFTRITIDEAMNLPLSHLAFSRFEFHYAFLLLMIGVKKYPYKFYTVLNGIERFVQDPKAQEGTLKNIDLLLLDSPSESAIKKNTDHFVKRNNCQQMCEPCAAIALYTKTQFVSPGGTGLRPGMYFNTVTYFIEKETLGETIKSNTSDSADTSIYFSIPNYYWLDSSSRSHGECSICGKNTHVITHFWQKGKPESEKPIYELTPYNARTINSKRFMVSPELPEISIIDGCSRSSYQAIPPEVISINATIGDNIIALNIFYEKAKLRKLSSHKFKLREKFEWTPIKLCVEAVLKMNTGGFNPDFKSTLAGEVYHNISDNILHCNYNEFRSSLNVLDMYCPNSPNQNGNPLQFMKKMKIFEHYQSEIKRINKIRLAREFKRQRLKQINQEKAISLLYEFGLTLDDLADLISSD
ncbi:type I-E CRISPR-associated protein Cse1/CasA [Xenorhabdus bovienii]|uniref:type I-E CRISPR-associated protein Cse1/CasA n=1 Tax=Xenorhabdus bovienii TaxID=40576 RepID=UPI0021586289|nr:type I-E CRISPR-associated protein Cse1/CasA [Xenorhabdus bovienii]